jgi:hypothetical protein
MLLERARPGAGGRVAVLTRNPTFGRLLEAVLEDWHLGAGAEAATSDVVLVERGLAAPQDTRRVVWLAPMPLSAELHLEVPLSLTELYHYLEKLFFPQPRHHIRLPLEQSVDLNVRGTWLVGRLLSISDRGARIACPALLPKGESLHLDFKLDGYPLRLAAEVIYAVPASDGSDREHPQAGLLFRPLRPVLRLALRHFIERSFIERARARTGIAENDASLSWISLVANPWGDLAD